MRNRSENQIKLVLIRHGATASNAEHRYLGRTDETLSGAGRRQLQEANGEKRYPQVQVLFSSPMRRCLESAAILYPEAKPVVIPNWKEMDFGAFEGRNYKELQGDMRYQAWIDSNGTLPFPEGEGREEFVSRCCEGLQEVLKYSESLWDETHQGGLSQEEMFHGGASPGGEVPTIGAMVHGGTIMALLSSYGGGAYFDYQVPNGSGYQCSLEFVGKEIRISDIRVLGE